MATTHKGWFLLLNQAYLYFHIYNLLFISCIPQTQDKKPVCFFLASCFESEGDFWKGGYYFCKANKPDIELSSITPAAPRHEQLPSLSCFCWVAKKRKEKQPPPQYTESTPPWRSNYNTLQSLK